MLVGSACQNAEWHMKHRSGIACIRPQKVICAKQEHRSRLKEDTSARKVEELVTQTTPGCAYQPIFAHCYFKEGNL